MLGIVMVKFFSLQQVRFLFVGILNTIVGYGFYALFLWFKIPYLISNTLSTILGVLHSYLWNRFFTFQSKQKAWKEISKFILVYFGSYLLSTISLYFFVQKMGVNEYISGFINLFITTIISYIGHKKFSFKIKEKKSGNL